MTKRELQLKYMRVYRDKEIQDTWMQSANIVAINRCVRLGKRLRTEYGMTDHGMMTLRLIAAWDVWQAIDRGEYNYDKL